MVKHLGRLKVVVRRKQGKCGYPNCIRNREIEPGDKVFLLTKGGSLPDKPFVIFQTVFHRDCFSPYILYRFDELKMKDGGRPSIIQLDKATKTKRKNWLHERSKLIRQLKNIQDSEQLSRLISKIEKISSNIENTGYSIGKYGRRSKNDKDFNTFVKMMKERWSAPTDIKRRLESQVKWAVEQLTSNGIIGKEEAVESIFIEWQEEVNRRLELDKKKILSYEEVEERKLE